MGVLSHEESHEKLRNIYEARTSLPMRSSGLLWRKVAATARAAGIDPEDWVALGIEGYRISTEKTKINPAILLQPYWIKYYIAGKNAVLSASESAAQKLKLDTEDGEYALTMLGWVFGQED